MRFNFVSIAFAAGMAFAANPDNTTFQARPVGEYPHRQTSEKITIAVEQFVTDEQSKDAFGKANPWRSGILPVLVVVQNDSPNALRVDRLRFVYLLPDRRRIESTPAAELKFLRGAKQPSNNPMPSLGGIKLGKNNKNPLAAWEIEGRAFTAKMVPPGQSASGFVYFQTPTTSEAASMYICGLVNATSGNELYYFEIPLSGK
ncbi:MAG: hypothetical protein QOJ99_5099 [Bryobacterales bacterium]|nr:hypothetical protein [Bryobacterales bacterium]